MRDFIQLTILIIAIVLLARLSSLVSRRVGIPVVTIQLLLGVLLGPSVLNLTGSPIILGTRGTPSRDPMHDVLMILAEVGLVQLMFLVGLKADWPGIKGMLKPVFSVGGYCFVLAAAAVTTLAVFFVDRWPEALAVGAILGASSFGMTVYSLTQIRLTESPFATVTEGASALAGFLAVLLMIATLAANYVLMFGSLNMTIAVAWFMGKLIMFFAVAYFLLSRFLGRGAGHFDKRPRQMLIGYLLLMAALYAWASLHFGSFAAAMLASLGGALLSVSSLALKDKVAEGLQSSMVSIPIGIFLILAGMEVNFREVGPHFIFSILIFAMSVGAKLLGGWWGTKDLLDSSRYKIRVITGIVPPGEMGILIAAYLFSRGLVTPSNFNITVSMVVILTVISTALVKIIPSEETRGQGFRVLRGQSVTRSH